MTKPDKTLCRICPEGVPWTDNLFFCTLTGVDVSSMDMCPHGFSSSEDIEEFKQFKKEQFIKKD